MLGNIISFSRMVPSLIGRSGEGSAGGFGRSIIPQNFAATAPLLIQQQPAKQHVQQHAVRWNWQAVIRKRFDRRTGKFKYEDWDVVMCTFQEPELLDGTTLLQRHLNQKYHIKPKEVRRRLNEAKVYRRSVRKIDNLTKYIRFIKEKGGEIKPKE